MSFYRSLLTLCIFLIPFLAATKLSGAIPWANTRYSHFSQGEDLRTLLRSFISEQGINGVVNDSISGVVNGRFDDMPPQTFFDGMVTANSLVWFYDGTNLYVDPSSDVRPMAVQLAYVSAQRLTQAINDLGYEASKWSITKVPQANIVNISGPTKFVTKVLELANALNSGLAEKDTIRVFSLKYAWAQDTSLAYQGGSLTVPGVATQLQQLMFGQTGMSSNNYNYSPSVYGGTLSTPQKVSTQQNPMTPLGNIGADNSPLSNSGNNPNAVDPSGNNSQKNQPSAAPSNPSTLASIQANPYLNAIVVRDSAGRMPLYEEAIRMLDKPVPIIEITVSIVDIDTQFSRELGNRLFALEKTTGNTFTIGAAPAGGVYDAAPDSTNNGTFSTFPNIGLGATVNAYKFAEAIRALEVDNHAQTLSRPSILTLDNTEAVINRQDTFYVSITAQYATNLYNVNAGVMLQVTPHLITENDEHKIKLLVNIQDGAIDFATTVNTLPTVSQSTLTTQAVIKEGQGLLIAGQYKQRNEKGDSGLPLLGRLPVIGYLFSNKNKIAATNERLYLITPKIIDLSAVPDKPYQQFFKSPMETKGTCFEELPSSYATGDESYESRPDWWSVKDAYAPPNTALCR